MLSPKRVKVFFGSMIKKYKFNYNKIIIQLY